MNISKMDKNKNNIYKDLDRIREIILDMNKNRDEDHAKVINYINKMAKVCYSEEDEERFLVAMLLHSLSYKVKGKKIVLK
jgi:hypothetical protein